MMVDGECKAAARMAAREGHGCVNDGGIRIARQRMRSSDRHRNAKRAVALETISSVF
jgi:hypothetical protein